MTVSGGPTVEFTETQDFAALSLSASGARAQMMPYADDVLRVGTISIASGAMLDLNDSDMIVRTTPFGDVRAQIVIGRNGGLWTGAGITSTNAQAGPPRIKALGMLSGSEYAAIYSSAVFHGITVDATDTLVTFTYNGDADFNGVVNFDDYGLADQGFLHNRTGWVNGDFNYSGTVNFDDYSLIDLAFVNQGVALRGGPNPALLELGQMSHFTADYMEDFIDWCEEQEIYFTPEDFGY